nr:DUF3331 domain-containing protein [Caballeronia sp. AZ7_KS35]
MDDERPPLHLSIVEKLSSSTISVRWSDPCFGHYANPLWGMCSARTDAICALSGARIRRGDTVFRPRAYGSQLPIIRNRMILASAVSSVFENSTS